MTSDMKSAQHRRMLQGLRIAAGTLALAALVPNAAAVVNPSAVGYFDPATFTFYVDTNRDGTAETTVVFGAAGDTGLLADVTGAGTKSPATFNAGTWKFMTGPAAPVTWGLAGDIPLVGDPTGAGRDSIVVYRAGTWFVSGNVDGKATAIYSFGGLPGDIPLLADIDGDGKADLIIYRSGMWFVSTKRDGVADIVMLLGGNPGDIPVAFDFDGDGRADPAIFNAGNWSVSTAHDDKSEASFTFGAAGDVPMNGGPGQGGGTAPPPNNDAARFLAHASFGATAAEIAKVTAMGMPAYVDAQLLMPATPLPVFAVVPENQPANCTSPLTAGGPPDPFGTNCPRDLYSTFAVQRAFAANALTAPDQLRQRVAWALSQIWVTSAQQDGIAYPMRNYQQILLNGAFGNFRTLMRNVTVDPFMGNYLDMVNNAKANPAAGTSPNENYAREIMQLFSIGLVELNNDGTPLLDATLQTIPTYTQTDITVLSGLFTGWTYAPIAPAVLKFNDPINYASAMVPCEGAPNCGTTNFHDQTAKSAAGMDQAPTFPAGQTADQDLNAVLDYLFLHPNVGPFIGKQLIQHLVMSNPSPQYVNRVASIFNDDGTGTRGNMAAVVKAVLLDAEALAAPDPVDSKAGKLKEPVLMLTSFLRAMNAQSDGEYLLLQTPNMGQSIFNSPTVFNYYPADFQIPGTSLDGPQFGIYDAPKVFARANTLWNLTLGSTCPAATPNICNPNGTGGAADASVAGAVGTHIDYNALAAAANNVATLVQQVDNMLMFGTMPPAMNAQIVNAVNAVPTSTPITAQQLLDRARTAVYLTVTSPRFQVEF